MEQVADVPAGYFEQSNKDNLASATKPFRQPVLSGFSTITVDKAIDAFLFHESSPSVLLHLFWPVSGLTSITI